MKISEGEGMMVVSQCVKIMSDSRFIGMFVTVIPVTVCVTCAQIHNMDIFASAACVCAYRSCTANKAI